MSKISSSVVLVILLVVVTAATAGARPAFGFKSGLVGADQTWEYSNILGTVGRDHRLGLAAGLFVNVPLAEHLQFVPEALYVQKGSQVEVTHMTYTGVPDGTETYKDRIDYLSLGAIVKLRTSAGSLGLYFLGGPRVDLKIGTSSALNSSDIDVILDAYKSSVAGFTAGLGIDGGLGANGLLFGEVCYQHDFSEAAKYVGEEATLTIDNRTILFLVGVTF